MCAAFFFGAVVAVNPFAMGTYFPRGMSFALRVKGFYLSVDQKKAGRECTFLRPPWAKRLSLAEFRQVCTGAIVAALARQRKSGLALHLLPF